MKGRWPDARAFPSEAHDALSDAQLRRNLRQATATIRTKRAASPKSPTGRTFAAKRVGLKTRRSPTCPNF